MKKVLIMGLPGAGKTTLANELAPLLKAVVFNADALREACGDLGFSAEDRLKQAKRMGFLCDQVVKAGYTAIADFVCPTRETRIIFGYAFIIWIDRIKEGRFADTNRLFEPPKAWQYDLRLAEGTPKLWALKAYNLINLK